MYREDSSPGWAFLDIFLFALTWFAGYNNGVNTTKREYEDKAMKDEIQMLREKLAEQNRINEQVRRITGIPR